MDSCSAVRSLESVVDIIQSWFARSKSMGRSVTVRLTVINNRFGRSAPYSFVAVVISLLTVPRLVLV